MGDLGLNSVWSDISKKASNAETDVLGPAYSYADNVPSTSKLGVGSDGNFGQLGRNLGAVGTYVKTLINGDPPLGNRFFVNTGGTCTAPDGSKQPRHNYINNMPEGAHLVPKGMGDLTSDFNGLVPGVVGDIEGLNPLYMMSALAADSSPPCKCYQCNVTTGGNSFFLSPDLSPDFSTDDCREVSMSNCPTVKQTEEFSVFSEDVAVPALIVGIALCSLYLLRKH